MTDPKWRFKAQARWHCWALPAFVSFGADLPQVNIGLGPFVFSLIRE